MNKQDRSDLAKAAGETCGSLACISICFAVFVIALSSSVEYYQVEVLSVVSIMVGIALACLFARLTLFSSECKDCKPDKVFKPLVWHLAWFSVLGAVVGLLLSTAYNNDCPDRICYEVVMGLDRNTTEHMMAKCLEYRHNILQLLNGVLAAFPIFLIIWAVAATTRKISRVSSGKPAGRI